MTTLNAAAFEEQRDIEHDERRAARASLRDNPPFGPTHHRMKDPLETAQRRRVAEHKPAQALTIDPAGLAAYSGKRRFDQSDRCPSGSEKPMDLRIGIE